MADANDRLRLPAWHPARVLIWGAHGGAGTTTLAAWLHPAADMGSMRPGLYPRYPAAIAQGRPLIVACGVTAHAAGAATTAVTAVNRAGARVNVLAIVGDGWPEPAAVTSRFRLLEQHVGGIVRIPFAPGMRLIDDPATSPMPRQARRAIDQIRAFAALAPQDQFPDLPRRS